MPEGNDVAVRDDPKTFPGMLTAFKNQIALALPKHLTADRMARIALTAYRLNPMLGKCEPASLFAAVIQAAQLGLEIGLNGRAYLVPYKKRDGTYECQFIPGWKGLVELANRTGRASVWTGAVFDGDQFEYELGDNPYVKHRPGAEDDPAKLLYTYAVGRIRGNEYPVIEVWSNAKLRKHFLRYNKVGDRHYAHDNWEMYARKIPLLQVLKYMPSSPELEAAIAMSNVADGNQAQGLNVKDAIEGTFAPPPMRDDGDDAGGTEATGGNQGVKDALKAKDAMKEAATTRVTFQAVADKLNGAAKKKDVDMLDAHATLIVEAPAEHHAELKKLYQDLRAELVA